MTKLVLDTGVYLAMFLPGPYDAPAERLLRILTTGRTALLAPDVVIAEFCSHLTELMRQKILTATEVESITAIFKECPLQLVFSLDYISFAIKIIRQLDISFSQALFLAVAIRNECKLITTDYRSFSKIALSTYNENCLLLKDLDR